MGEFIPYGRLRHAWPSIGRFLRGVGCFGGVSVVSVVSQATSKFWAILATQQGVAGTGIATQQRSRNSKLDIDNRWRREWDSKAAISRMLAVCNRIRVKCL
jgi:hypothetical protein